MRDLRREALYRGARSPTYSAPLAVPGAGMPE